MKPGTRSWKKFMRLSRQFSIVVFTIGGVMFVNDIEYGKWALSIDGFVIAIYAFLKGFEPVHEEPNWELVYPELGLGHSEDLDDE